jgi:hypothetical protein
MERSLRCASTKPRAAFRKDRGLSYTSMAKHDWNSTAARSFEANPMPWLACYSAPTSPEAHLVKGFLEQRGVPCLLLNDGPTMYPSAAFGMRVRVLVPEHWLPVASKLVDRRRRARPRRVVAMPLRRRAR